MSPHELPCTPAPELRPHVVRTKNRELVRSWLDGREGVVIYVPYPTNQTSPAPVTLAPVLGAHDSGPAPAGDRYIYRNGEKARLASGSLAVMAARVLQSEDPKLVAADVIIPEMEYPGDPNAVEKTLTTAFKWIGDDQ